MAGIYIHIPFCSKACHYCDFHFSTKTENLNELSSSLLDEIRLRRNELGSEVSSVYFGGGTPSLLSQKQIEALLETCYSSFSVSKNAEITLEANPDDLDLDKLRVLKDAGINRLSIGVQSLQDPILEWMNRSHNSKQARKSIYRAQEIGIRNISADIIFAVPGLSTSVYLKDLEELSSWEIPHLSVYGLTVEHGTALGKWVREGNTIMPEASIYEEQFLNGAELLKSQNYSWYETSNFAKDGMESKHNSAYWKRNDYLGIGPSAHSFIGGVRSWNISQNATYIKSIHSGKRPFQEEKLSLENEFNEKIMTGIRTKAGINLSLFRSEAESDFLEELRAKLKSEELAKYFLLKEESYILKQEFKIIEDRIASDLFVESN